MIVDNKKEAAKDVNVEQIVRRFLDDENLKFINEQLFQLHSKRMPDALVIKKDGSMEFIYDEKTMKAFQYWQTQRYNYIRMAYPEIIEYA